jgi:hypothetical protein
MAWVVLVVADLGWEVGDAAIVLISTQLRCFKRGNGHSQLPYLVQEVIDEQNNGLGRLVRPRKVGFLVKSVQHAVADSPQCYLRRALTLNILLFSPGHIGSIATRVWRQWDHVVVHMVGDAGLWKADFISEFAVLLCSVL